MYLLVSELELKYILQGKKVPKRAYVRNLKLSARFGHKYDYQRFSNSPCADCNYLKKNYFQHIIKHNFN